MLSLGVAIGRDDQRRAGQREQLVFRADEDLTPGPRLGQVEDAHRLVLLFSSSNSSRSRSICSLSCSSRSGWRDRARSAARLALSPCRTRRRARARPGRATRVELARISRRLRSSIGCGAPRARSGRGRDGIEKIRRLGQAASGGAGRKLDDAVFHLIDARRQARQAPCVGSSRMNSIWCRTRVAFGGDHQTRAARQPGKHAAGVGEQLFHRMVRAACLTAFDRRPLVGGSPRRVHEGVDKEAQPLLGRQAPGADMRRIDRAPAILKVAHHIAHGGRRKRHRQHASTDCASRAARRSSR